MFSKKDITFEKSYNSKDRAFEIKRHLMRTRNIESEGELFKNT